RTTRSGISRRTTRACASAGPTKFGADPVTLAFALTLLALGFVGAFVAGLLGVGGAIVMIPLLLYVPPLIEVGALDIKAVAGVTMTQVLGEATADALAPPRRRTTNRHLECA